MSDFEIFPQRWDDDFQKMESDFKHSFPQNADDQSVAASPTGNNARWPIPRLIRCDSGRASAPPAPTASRSKIVDIPGQHTRPKPETPTVAIPDHVDPFAAMKAETAQRNAVSAAIESTERYNKHMEKAWDQQNFFNSRSLLSQEPIFPLRKTIEVTAPLPYSCFPKPALEFIEYLSYKSPARRELAAGNLIGAFFCAAYGNWEIRDVNGTCELVTGYMLISAKSGIGKSNIATTIRRPFEEVENEWQQQHLEEQPEATNDVLKDIIKALRKNASKSTERTLWKELDVDAVVDCMRDDYAEIRRLEMAIKKGVIFPRLLLDKVTTEKLPFELMAQNEAVVIIDAEGGPFTQKNLADVTIFLEAYMGEKYSFASQTNEFLNLLSPYLGMCLSVQPDKMKKIYGNPKFSEYGLTARILPLHVSGLHTPDYGSPSILKESETWYNNKMRSLLNYKRDGGRYTLELDPEAQRFMTAFHAKIDMYKTVEEFQHCNTFINRLSRHALRLAAALHLMHHDRPHTLKVSGKTMSDAIDLAEYFLQHASAAFNPKNIDGIKYAEKILKWMKGTLSRPPKSHFSAREAQNGIGHCTIVQIMAGLEELESRNIIRCYEMKPNKSPCYVVHPRAYW